MQTLEWAQVTHYDRDFLVQCRITSNMLSMKKIASEPQQATGLNKVLDDGFMYAFLVGPLRGDFRGESGINYDMCSDSAIMINIIVIEEGQKTVDFNIQAADLLLCMLDAEIHDHTIMISRLPDLVY